MSRVAVLTKYRVEVRLPGKKQVPSRQSFSGSTIDHEAYVGWRLVAISYNFFSLSFSLNPASATCRRNRRMIDEAQV
jgi:hypothetical protein